LRHEKSDIFGDICEIVIKFVSNFGWNVEKSVEKSKKAINCVFFDEFW